ncbi:MAG TPA: carbon-nitrogen hydrolase [Kiritimatiellia bacterium]|nr:carbon-nitrogen hydrolase [Kiritimatiellia bacterium]
MKISLLQMTCVPQPDANLAHAEHLARQAAAEGAEVIVLPELYRSLYFCQREDAELFDLAEPLDGPTNQTFQAVARETGTVIITSFFERRAPGLYHNTAAIIDTDGSIAGLYRKMHIPDDPAFYEKFYFTPGDLGFKATPTAKGRIGVLICWDQWYPEAARLTALCGADLLVYPTAIGWHPAEKSSHGASQREAWMTIQRSHAIANGVFMVSANRVGHEVLTPGTPGLEFWGTSFIADPFGVILAQGSTDTEQIVSADLNLHRIEETRRGWPFLRDRRIDAYADITRRYIDP